MAAKAGNNHLNNEPKEFSAAQLSVPPEPALKSGHWRNFALMTAALALCFSVPLYELVKFAVGSDLYSYILLIPFISVYLARLKWKSLPSFSGAAQTPAIVFFAGGLAVLAGYALVRHSGFVLAEDDYLAFMASASFLFFAGGCCWFLGGKIVRALAFPIGFLVFMVPMPAFLRHEIESFLQTGSAIMAEGFFKLTGATFLRDGLVFQLPGINLEVAPECSGIHSSLVLFITSAMAGYLFLNSTWKRAILMLAVIPLALLRNGFRVYVIGELCTHIGPQMINSPIHRHGGPLFFALSLIPFFLLLIFLRRSERAGKNSKNPIN
jgi:exosortase C (VPDSG-CTERM-specific)